MTIMMMVVVMMMGVCRPLLVDSSAPAARLVLNAGEDGVKVSGSQKDGTQ